MRHTNTDYTKIMEKYQVTYAPSFSKETMLESKFKPVAKGRIINRPSSVSSSSLGSSILSINEQKSLSTERVSVSDKSSDSDGEKTLVRIKTISRSSLASCKSNMSNDSGASFRSTNTTASFSEELNSRSVALQLVI